MVTHGDAGRGVGAVGGASHSHAVLLPHVAGARQRPAGRSARQSGGASVLHHCSAAHNGGLGLHCTHNRLEIAGHL